MKNFSMFFGSLGLLYKAVYILPSQTLVGLFGSNQVYNYVFRTGNRPIKTQKNAFGSKIVIYNRIGFFLIKICKLFDLKTQRPRFCALTYTEALP